MKDSFRLAPLIIRNADGGRIAVAQVDDPAFIFGNARGQNHLYARPFNTILVRADPFYMGGMSENAPRGSFCGAGVRMQNFRAAYTVLE